MSNGVSLTNAGTIDVCYGVTAMIQGTLSQNGPATRITLGATFTNSPVSACTLEVTGSVTMTSGTFVCGVAYGSMMGYGGTSDQLKCDSTINIGSGEGLTVNPAPGGTRSGWYSIISCPSNDLTGDFGSFTGVNAHQVVPGGPEYYQVK